MALCPATAARGAAHIPLDTNKALLRQSLDTNKALLRQFTGTCKALVRLY